MVDRTLAEFVKEALAKGAERIQIERALVASGWPKDQARAALSSYADTPFVVPVPLPKRYVSAREAFLYLVLFILLGVLAGHLGALLFVLVDIFMPPEVVQSWQADFAAGTIRWSVSALTVALPVFLTLAWRLSGARRRNPAMQGSRIRKWLTYVTLVIAAATIIGDLIAVVYSLLSGEVTMKFLIKAFIIAAIAGVIFSYYVTDAERDEDQKPAPLGLGLGAAAALVTIAAGITGISLIDSPAEIRAQERDSARLDAIVRIAGAVDCYTTYEGAPPQSLEAMRSALEARARTTPIEYSCTWYEETDPATGAAYEYAALGGSAYEVCATFDRESAPDGAAQTRSYYYSYDLQGGSRTFNAIHGAGRHCFKLEAKAVPGSREPASADKGAVKVAEPPPVVDQAPAPDAAPELLPTAAPTAAPETAPQAEDAAVDAPAAAPEAAPPSAPVATPEATAEPALDAPAEAPPAEETPAGEPASGSEPALGEPESAPAPPAPTP